MVRAKAAQQHRQQDACQLIPLRTWVVGVEGRLLLFRHLRQHHRGGHRLCSCFCAVNSRAQWELRTLAIHSSVTRELPLHLPPNRRIELTMSTTATVSAQCSGTFSFGGKTPVHRLGFGAMRLTGDGIWGEPKDRAEAKRVLKRAVELGVTFIDTDDSYGPYVSEEIIAEALHPYPKGLIVATKGGLVRTGPNQWLPVGRPEYLQQEVELSLRRLKIERIDLWQLHRIDP